jgi:hypothetical protein
MQIWGGPNIRRELKSCMLVIVVIFLLTLVADTLLMGSTPFYQEASALPREFEQNITILANDMQALELVFGQGDELELIFSMGVQQDLPIDVWFVNYANYIRLVDGNEFLFFIDGSQQEIKTAQKVVTVTHHDSYALVFANYNNVTVDVYLTYDINIYPEEEPTTDDKGEEIPLWKEPYVMLPLGLIIGILVGLFASRMLGRSKRGAPKAAAKAPSKKAKAKKPKKAKPKAAEKTPAKKEKIKRIKKKEPVITKKVTAEEIEEVESGEVEEEEPEVVEKAPEKEAVEPKAVEKVPSTRFCGHCGKPVDTQFCPFCGKEVGKA